LGERLAAIAVPPGSLRHGDEGRYEIGARHSVVVFGQPLFVERITNIDKELDIPDSPKRASNGACGGAGAAGGIAPALKAPVRRCSPFRSVAEKLLDVSRASGQGDDGMLGQKST
jgi:hypothetical protein